MRFFIFLALGTILPVSAHASVLINEIAWMGTSASANDEWIELFNPGTDSVDVSGWMLIAADGEPSITLSGIIGSGAFFLLERTDDESIPGIPADVIYVGTMANTGEIFELRDATGAIIDTVVGGPDWELVGGDNVTKHTGQRQPDDTWITGVPTPSMLNTAEDTGSVAGTSTQLSSSSGVKKKTVTGGYKQVVFAYAGEDRNVVVGARTAFEGFAVSDKNSRLGVATYTWSFGDGATKRGKEVTHTFHEPGTYVVTLKVSGEHQRSKDSIRVTAIPADVSVSETIFGDGGAVYIRNHATVPLDVSSWRILLGSETERGRDASFVIPEETFIAPEAETPFPAEVTGLSLKDGDRVALAYPDGSIVAEHTAVEPEEESMFVENETELMEENEVVVVSKETEPPQVIIATNAVATTSVAFSETRSEAVPLSALPEESNDGFRIFLYTLIGIGVIAALFLMLSGKGKRVSEEDSDDGTGLLARDFDIINTTPKGE